jgi:hypothetical protein
VGTGFDLDIDGELVSPDHAARGMEHIGVTHSTFRVERSLD